MLLKGVFIGAANSVVLVWMFVWLLRRRAQAVAPGPTSIDIRGFRGVLPFFGGVGIGYLVTMTLLVVAAYALVRYGQHMAGLK